MDWLYDRFDWPINILDDGPIELIGIIWIILQIWLVNYLTHETIKLIWLNVLLDLLDWLDNWYDFGFDKFERLIWLEDWTNGVLGMTLWLNYWTSWIIRLIKLMHGYIYGMISCLDLTNNWTYWKIGWTRSTHLMMISIEWL